ncbi:hypothetical protein [Mycobacterium sp. NPDC050441]|uniref:hypothetical protein n=1 Tax=Mycobacterium sp. NPDC050441 TaxID=3155403 RepID=UPI003400F7E3
MHSAFSHRATGSTRSPASTPRIADSEPVRAPLLMLSNVLHLWYTVDFAALLDEFERL